MKAVVITKNGGPGVLKLQEVECPHIEDDEVLIRVAATSINRFDLRQRSGCFRKLHRGFPAYPGIECSGEVMAVGGEVFQWEVGDQVVCALLDKGGYADEVVVPAGQVLSVPRNVSLEDAASLPVVACTIWLALFEIGNLNAGETLLVRDGSSDVGIFAIQIAKYKGAKVLVTADCEEKLTFCRNLGADVCINCRTENFSAWLGEVTNNKGVKLVLDTGAINFDQNISCLAGSGKVLIVDLHCQPVAKVHIGHFIDRHYEVQVVDLQQRSSMDKALIVSQVQSHVWPAIEKGLKPVIYRIFSLSEVAEAHKLMEGGKFIGKILLIPDMII